MAWIVPGATRSALDVAPRPARNTRIAGPARGGWPPAGLSRALRVISGRSERGIMRATPLRTLLILLPAGISILAQADSSRAGPFPDKNLEAAVRAALHLDDKADLDDEKLKN